MQVGIYATELTRRPIDIRGTSFPVEFRIVDKAPTVGELKGKPPPDGADSVEVKRLGSPYAVKVLLQVWKQQLNMRMNVSTCGHVPAACCSSLPRCVSARAKPQELLTCGVVPEEQIDIPCGCTQSTEQQFAATF